MSGHSIHGNKASEAWERVTDTFSELGMSLNVTHLRRFFLVLCLRFEIYHELVNRDG